MKLSIFKVTIVLVLGCLTRSVLSGVVGSAHSSDSVDSFHVNETQLKMMMLAFNWTDSCSPSSDDSADPDWTIGNPTDHSSPVRQRYSQSDYLVSTGLFGYHSIMRCLCIALKKTSPPSPRSSNGSRCAAHNRLFELLSKQ